MVSLRDFGWLIESTDEEVYGPVTKEILQNYLREGVISPNTLVRHCTDPDFAPIAEQGIAGEEIDLSGIRRTGDTIGEVWPKKTKDRMALAAGDVECARHRRPAILSCIRCLAPYCSKCRMKRRGTVHFMCKKCQGSVYNRRTGAYILDALLLTTLPTYAIGLPAMYAIGPEVGAQVLNLASFAGTAVFFFRDPLLKGSGPGKRLFNLQVVKHEDGQTRLTYGQGFLRTLSLIIPIFNLIDASVPYRDPLQRRFGDKWAKTRVIDTDRAVTKIREKVQRKLQDKGIELAEDPVMSLQQYARLG